MDPKQEMNTISVQLDEIYSRLLEAYGPQHWWPADTALEVMIGAVLTQNTTWQSVEKAIANLKRNDLLSLAKLYALPPEQLARLIRPSGYFNLKAQRLKNLIELVAKTFGGSLEIMGQVETERLRNELLTVKGVGPETADSILLYAFHRPIFVVDGYTRRVYSRHCIIEQTAHYQELQELVMDNLPSDVYLFNEYHALLVRVGKLHCQSKPRCQGCPLESLLPSAGNKD
jgi:endonuclease-3 related protein